jgi:hypothetical protein
MKDAVRRNKNLPDQQFFKMLAGDGSAWGCAVRQNSQRRYDGGLFLSQKALYDKALDENGKTEKPGQEDAVRWNKNLPGHQFFKTLNVSRPPK